MEEREYDDDEEQVPPPAASKSQKPKKINSREDEVRKELLRISEILQARSDRLDEREADLGRSVSDVEELRATMESALHEAKIRIQAEAARDIEQRIALFESEQVNGLKQQLDTQTRESQRQMTAFNEMRAGNARLRERIAELERENKDLQLKLASSNGRVKNLQRDVELVRRKSATAPHTVAHAALSQIPPPSIAPVKTQSTAPIIPKKMSSTIEAVFDVLSVLMDTSTAGREANLPITMCIKVLPSMGEVMCSLQQLSPTGQQHCLIFTYRCITTVVTDRQQQAVKTTLRRIGEEVFASEHRSTASSASLLQSADCTTRVISSLVILASLTQGQCLSRFPRLLYFIILHSF